MTYDTQRLASGVNCARLPYLSNPNLALGGAPLGNAALGNNLHTPNRTAKAVAA